MLQKIESQKFGHLLRAEPFHPYVYQVGIHLLCRHDKRCKYLTFAYVFFPEFYGKPVVLAIFSRHLLQFRKGDSPVDLIGDTFLAHGLRGDTVHQQAERLLDGLQFLVYLFVHFLLILRL